jgi:uncharacterized protein (DUF2062 family)
MPLSAASGFAKGTFFAMFPIPGADKADVMIPLLKQTLLFPALPALHR